MKLIIRFILIVFISCYCGRLQAQLDSLQFDKALKKALNLCYENKDSAFLMINQLYDEALQNDDSYFIGKTLNIKGIYFDVTNQWDSALFYYKKAGEYAKKTKHKKLYGSTLNNIGLIYWNKSENEKAIDYFINALRLFEEAGYKEGVANIYSNLALIYRDQYDIDKAIDYQHKALAINKQLNARHNIAIAYTNLGAFYKDINADSSLYYLKKSIDLKKLLNDNYGLGIGYDNLGAYFLDIPEPDSAIYYFKKSISFLEPFNNFKLLASNYASLGKAYTLKNDYNNALLWLQKAEALALEHELNYQLLMAYDRLAQLYENKNDFKNSASYYKKTYKLYHKIFDIEKDKQIAELEQKYQSEKQEKQLLEKDKQLVQQKYENNIKSLLIVIAILIILFIVLFGIGRYKKYQLQKEKEQQEKLNHQRNEISRELHDNIGSNLTYISSTLDYLNYKTKEKEIASLSQFTKDTIKQLRETVKSLKSKEITTEEFQYKINELIATINDAHTGVNINFQFDLPEKLKLQPLENLNIFRIIQESINNALKHSQASEIVIKIHQKLEKIIIKITDNGIGFNIDDVSKNGLTNIQKRAEAISADLTIKSEIGKGTSIMLTL